MSTLLTIAEGYIIIAAVTSSLTPCHNSFVKLAGVSNNFPMVDVINYDGTADCVYILVRKIKGGFKSLS